jgi:hypothetical protein
MTSTGEAEIRRTAVQGQPRQTVQETPSQPIKMLGLVVCFRHPRYTRSINRNKGIVVHAGLDIKQDPVS